MNSHELRNLQEAYMEVYEERREDKQRNRNPLFGPSGKMTKTQKEETDLYDLILSHLLDEGYADTQEGAEVILENMSEDWRESICEEYKKLPVGKMLRKAVEIGLRSEHPSGRLDTRMAGRKRVAKMAQVADDHDPVKAKRKR
jgi:hypothetical protein